MPLTEHRTADGEPILFQKRQRIGQIIWEMDKDKYFDQIYKPVTFGEQEQSFAPRVSAAYYPVQNDGTGLIGKIPDPKLFNDGFGQVIMQDKRVANFSDEWQA